MPTTSNTGPGGWLAVRINKIYGVAEDMVDGKEEGSVVQGWDERVHRVLIAGSTICK